MRRVTKISAARLPLRKSVAAAGAPHRAFPAWIDCDEGPAFPVLAPVPPNVTARVRDSLVLRTVASAKSKRSRPSFDAPGGR